MSRKPLQIEGRNLARRHPDGQGWLLDGVTLAVEPGSRTSIGGPSGSGKTLLLRALAMLDPLDRGEIRFEGGAAVVGEPTAETSDTSATVWRDERAIADAGFQALALGFGIHQPDKLSTFDSTLDPRS